MKCIEMSIVYLHYKVFIILEVRVALISYSLSKATSKTAENNVLIALISPLLPVPLPECGMNKQMMVSTANNSYQR